MPLRTARLRAEPLEDRLTPSDGAPDPTFGTGGSRFVTLDPAKPDEFTALTVAPDGKFVMTAAVTTITTIPGPHGLPSFLFDYDMSVVRTLADGSPDPSFGTAGVAALPPYTTTRDWEVTGAGADVTTGPGGSVVAVIAHLSGGVVYRLTADGQLDPAFGTGGRVLVQRATDILASAPYRVAGLADGSVLVAAVGQDWVDVTKLTPAGAVDPTFGTNGTARATLGAAPGGVAVIAGDLLVTPDGRVVVAWIPGPPDPSVPRQNAVAVARLTAAGAADPTFGTNGVATVPVPNVTQDVALAAGPFGRVYVAGRLYFPGAGHPVSELGNDGFAVARLTPAGGLDPGFGTNGVATAVVAMTTWNTNGSGCHVTALRDGRVVVAGEAGAGFGAARLTAAGQPDPTFGTNGLAKDPSPVQSPASNILFATESRQVEAADVLPDGRVILAGSRTTPGRTDADAELVALTGSDPPASPATPVALVGGPADGTARGLDPLGRAGDPIAFFPGAAVTVRAAPADVTGDGVADLIGGAGPGGGPQVRILDGRTGGEVASFFAFEPTFTGGVYVTTADFDGDGKAELIVTPDQSGGPVVAVFDGAKLAAGLNAGAERGRFLGIEDPDFRGGARAAAGDLTGDGRPELVVAAGFGGGPRVAVFAGTSFTGSSPLADQPSRVLGDFFVFEPTLRNGAYVSLGDVTGDGVADLAFGAGPGGAPRVRVLDGGMLFTPAYLARTITLLNISWEYRGPGDIPVFLPATHYLDGGFADFFAGDSAPRGGVHPLLRDVDGDGKTDLLAGSGEGEPARVRVYTSATLLAGAAAPDQEIDPFAGAAAPLGVFVG